MPHRSPISSFVPVLPALAGLALSILRFRAHDPLGGLAAGLGGFLLMFPLAVWISRSPRT